MVSSTAQLPSQTVAVQTSPELPTHVLQDLGLAASDLENPSRQTVDKIVSKLQETLGLLETARYRLAQYGDREPLLMPSTKNLHCVRCHQDYAESQNMKQACVIAHWGDLDRVSKHSSGSTWEWDGCGCTFESDDYDDCGDGGDCYKGRHTINPDEVEYINGNEEDAQKDAAGSRRVYYEDEGVRTCKERGCTKDSGKSQRRE